MFALVLISLVTVAIWTVVTEEVPYDELNGKAGQKGISTYIMQTHWTVPDARDMTVPFDLMRCVSSNLCFRILISIFSICDNVLRNKGCKLSFPTEVVYMEI